MLQITPWKTRSQSGINGDRPFFFVQKTRECLAVRKLFSQRERNNFPV